MSHKIPLFEKMFNGYGFSEEEKLRYRVELHLLKLKDKETYLHSVRLALLSGAIAKRLGMDPKPLFSGASRHDMGKLLIPSSVLKKKKNWNEQDQELMRTHPTNAFRMTESTNAFSAHTDVHHHRHGEKPYPRRVPKGKVEISPKSRRLAFDYSKPLAIADCWDAAVNRRTSRFDGKELTLETVKAEMLRDLSRIKPLVNKLFDEKFFTEKMLKESVIGKVNARKAALLRTTAKKASVKRRIVRRR